MYRMVTLDGEIKVDGNCIEANLARLLVSNKLK